MGRRRNMGFLKSFYDYMFYRTYRVYAKYDDIPRFNSTSLLALCTCNIIMFIPFSINELIRSWDFGGTIVIYGYVILMTIFFFRKYNKKHIADITRKYARNKWNKKNTGMDIYTLFPNIFCHRNMYIYTN